MNVATITEALSEARTLVAADGGDLELIDVDAASSTVNLQLVLDGVECHECVMPRPILEEMLTNMLRTAVPGVAQVTLADPRELPDYVSPDTT
jgi:Fe-S cluster biogenesis protein NfuA